MKKILIAFLCFIMLFGIVSHAEFSIDSAYNDFKTKHPEFVKTFTDSGISEELLISFITDSYSYLLEMNSDSPVTKENFDSKALIAISNISSREKYYSIQDVILINYPSAIRVALSEGKVADELKPIVNTIKDIIFSHNILDIKEKETVLTAPQYTFSDLPATHWAYDAVNVLSENFILNGYLDGTFKPEANITRGEFAKIIVSATNTLDAGASSSFSDVSESDWYYYYVSSALKEGYITGYPDGTFRPDDYITRADICTIVSRSLGSPTTVADSPFSDDHLIPSYAKIPVYALVRKEIINGMGDGTFGPAAFATRAQTAKIIYAAFFRN